MLAALTLRTTFAGFSKAVAASESALANGEATPSTLVGRAMTWVKTSFITPVVEPVATAPAPASRLLASQLLTPAILSLYTDSPTSALVKVVPSLFNPLAGPYRSPIRTQFNFVLNTRIEVTLYPYSLGYDSVSRWQLSSWQPREGSGPSRWNSDPSSTLDGDSAMWS